MKNGEVNRRAIEKKIIDAKVECKVLIKLLKEKYDQIKNLETILKGKENRAMNLDGKFEKGKIVHFHFWGDRNKLGNPDFIRDLLREIVEEIGMTPHGDVEIHTYPTPELGFTATACVAIQHLHESYVVYDNWIEYEPAYANIVVNSCRDYDEEKVVKVLKRRIEPEAIQVRGFDEYEPYLRKEE